MISFRFFKLLVLCGLLALGSCQDNTTAEVEDPCAEELDEDAASSLSATSVPITIWDTEHEAMRPAYPSFEGVEITAWVRDHPTFHGEFSYSPEFRSLVFSTGIDIPPHINGDSSYRYVIPESMYICPRPEWGENVYQVPFTIKFKEYDTKDSICIIIRKTAPCENDWWEFYLNGELIHASDENQYGKGSDYLIVLEKP